MPGLEIQIIMEITDLQEEKVLAKKWFLDYFLMKEIKLEKKIEDCLLQD